MSDFFFQGMFLSAPNIAVFRRFFSPAKKKQGEKSPCVPLRFVYFAVAFIFATSASSFFANGAYFSLSSTHSACRYGTIVSL